MGELMAQQDYTSLIVLAGAGALAWYGYQQGWFANLFPTAAAAPAPTTGNAPASAINCPAPNTMVNGVCTAPYVAPANPPTITQYNGPGATTAAQSQLASQLATAAPYSASGYNVDQWAYYYATIPGPSVTIPNPAPPYTGTITIPGNPMPLSGSQIEAILQAAGATGANRSNVLMTAPQFVALLASAGVAGLSGPGFYSGIPAGFIHGGW